MNDATRALPSDQAASGRSLGNEELALLAEVLERGILTSTRGTCVRELEENFAEMLGVPYVVACSSGSAAMHAAIAAIDPEPGEEFITTPITDMGAIAPILAQGAIPVFADVDPATCNVAADTIDARMSGRTRGIIATHLFGNPCDMAPVMALASRQGVPVIEDCAQAYLARDAGRLAGTIGDIAIFSLQQGKHMTCGEGGLVATRDAALAHRVRLFVNKGWDYGSPTPDHGFLAPNYRMSELQGAVALAQLRKLPRMVEQRRLRARALSAALTGIPGLALPAVRPGAEHAYWRYALRVDARVLGADAVQLGARLAERGISANARYIRKPAFECALFREQKTFGRSRWPFTLARPGAIDHDPGRFPGAYAALADIVVLPWNERLTAEDVEALAQEIRECVQPPVAACA
jgi:dTDP-4-amino-4,6-dideoxygalactose transaminase